MTIFNNNSVTSTDIDKINYGQSFNILSRANANNYTSIISHKDLLKLNIDENLQNIFKNNDVEFEKFLVMLSNVYQSITTKGLTTPEILQYIINSFEKMQNINLEEKKKLLEAIKDYIAIFQVDFLENSSKEDDIKSLVLKNLTYTSKGSLKNFYGDPKSQNSNNNSNIYNVASFLNFSDKSSSNNNNEDFSEKANKQLVNPTKENPNISVILLNNKNLRSGVKNSLELSSFFNLIPSLEYAKAYPFFNATFILPSISKQDSSSVFKTATLNQFLFASDTRPKTENFNNFEGRIIKNKDNVGVKTNLSVFTTPQTFVNMNEKIGHRDSLSEDHKKLRITSIHDSTQPFMTLKDFTIDVSPTKGLMSFKTGKISLVLHDRTRMVDIAPFIKPDLFGAFGAEIVVEYGWSHNESQSVKDTNRNNPIGEFLHSSRCIEKYMIVNSQFSIENNGQVNINLSIAMKGPIDIRQTEIFADAVKQIERSDLDNAIAKYNFTVEEATGVSISSGNFGNVRAALSNIYAGKTIDKDSLKTIDKINKRILKAIEVYKAIKHDQVVNNFNQSNRQYDILSLTGKTNLSDREVSDFNSIFSFSSPLGLRKNNSQEYEIRVKKGLFTINTSLFAVFESIKGVKSLIDSYLLRNENLADEKRDFIKSLIGGTQSHDMFFDKRLISLISGDKAKFKDFKISKNIISKDSYVSLGTIISSLIFTHMSRSEKYDEIQLVFNTVNDKAGLASSYLSHIKNNESKIMRPLNIASLLIKRDDLRKFLEKIFNERTRLTLESLISQIITNFIITRDNPCYGLSDLFVREDFDIPVKPKSKSKLKSLTSEFKNVKERLNYIYYKKQNNLHDAAPSFLPPGIHLTFDTLTSNDDMRRTICRIMVYDRNDNPYQSICDIYNEKFLSRSKDLRKLKQIEHELKSNSKNLNQAEISKLNTTADNLIKNLIDKDKGIFEKVDGKYQFKSGFGFEDLKEKYKKIVPAATFATQNTSLINASVATVNEGKLNTVYITRADRNNKFELNNKVILDSPLRILPAQASIEMFGCPWINFGQYIFLDFETGTTIDNIYAVTGVKHTIMPGKFSTQVSLSYGDAYGKYEQMADGFSKSLQKFREPDSVTPRQEVVESKVASTVLSPNNSIRKISQKNHAMFSIKSVFFDNANFDAKNVLIFLMQNTILIEGKEVISYENAKRGRNKSLESLLNKFSIKSKSNNTSDVVKNVTKIRKEAKLVKDVINLLKNVYEKTMFFDVKFTKTTKPDNTGYNLTHTSRVSYSYTVANCSVLNNTSSEFTLKVENKRHGLEKNKISEISNLYSEKEKQGIKAITGLTPEQILTKGSNINKGSLKIIIKAEDNVVDVNLVKQKSVN